MGLTTALAFGCSPPQCSEADKEYIECMAALLLSPLGSRSVASLAPFCQTGASLSGDLERLGSSSRHCFNEIGRESWQKSASRGMRVRRRSSSSSL